MKAMARCGLGKKQAQGDQSFALLVRLLLLFVVVNSAGPPGHRWMGKTSVREHPGNTFYLF
jgi:hypothetical protein